MSGLVEHVERAEIARWEAVYNEDLRCDSVFHESEPHYHAGNGEFRTVAPCGGGGVRCRKFVESLLATGGVSCYRCGERHPATTIRIFEL